MASLNTTMPATQGGDPLSLHTHLHTTLGAMFIGLIVAAMLFGVINVQTFVYYQCSKRDPKYMKSTVARFIASCLDLARPLLFMVTNFTDPAIITKPTWSLCLQVVVSTVSDFIVHIYFSRRVWIMSMRNWFLTGGSLLLSMAYFSTGMTFGIKIFNCTRIVEVEKLSWIVYTSLGLAVAADLWIAVTLCYLLGRKKTGFKATVAMVNTLLLYVINTGLLTVCIHAAHLRVYGVFTNFSKLYFNSLLATLNARGRFREDTTGNGGTFPMPRIMNVRTPPASKNAASFGTGTGTSNSLDRIRFNSGDKFNHGLAITVRTETSYHVDEVGMRLDHGSESILPL